MNKTLAEVKAWLAMIIPPVVKQVEDELLLIKNQENLKHNHFAKEKIHETLSMLPIELRNSLVDETHRVADMKNIMLKQGDCSSAKFIEIFKGLVSKAIDELKAKYPRLPEELTFDKDGRCHHDIECDKRIQDSLEYITHLITKHEQTK